MQGGFLPGSAYIVQGAPGTGKTILANQFCFAHVRGGGRALYMSLLAESHQRLIAYMSEMEFFDGSVLPDALEYVSAYGVLEREGLVGLLKLVHHEIKRHNASALILDGVFVAQAAATEMEFRKFVHEVQGVATFLNAVLVMLTHQEKIADGPEHTMVDGWIELSQETTAFRSYRTIQVHKHRGSGIIEGKHRVEIDAKGLSVYPRIESVPFCSTVPDTSTERVSSGIEEFDPLLAGGLPSASATLLLGPTGSGKTTLGLHFLSRCSREEAGLMLGFYESTERIQVKAESIGIDLKQLVETGALQLMWSSPSESVVDKLLWDLLARAKERKARRLFIDGLPALRDCFIHKERLVGALNAFGLRLREVGVTLLYTSEVRDLHFVDKLPTDEISAIVDNVILLNYTREEHAMRRQLNILKLRDSDFDPRSREFHIARKGFVLQADPRAFEVGEHGGE
jgi:circadian clock protein KaiC